MRGFSLLFTLLIPTVVFAKKVNVEWKQIKGAVSYEIQVERDGRVVVKKATGDNSWSGDLPSGPYAYQIRAIDRVKRPGQWSPPKALVVSPKPPELESPIDGKDIALYDPQVPIKLKWKSAEGVSKYNLIVKLGKQVVHKSTVEGTALTLKGLTPGEYSWSVAAVIEATDRAPASIRGRSWESAPSDIEDFEVEHKQLAQPVAVYPLGVIPPADGGKIQFEWKKVDGAEAYEIQVQDLVTEKSPSAPPRSRTFVTSDKTLTVALPGEGGGSWKVRALANIDETKVAGAIGPQSSADFNVTRNADFFAGSGYVALSSLVSPYTYRAVIPGQSANRSGSMALTLRLSGEYWFHPHFGANIGAENTNFALRARSSEFSFSRQTFELVGKYRAKLSKNKFSWSISPKAGLEYRDYFQIRLQPGTTTFISDEMGTIGAALGVDIRKQFTEKFSVGAKLAYFYPLMLTDATSSDGTSIAQKLNGWGANRRNFNFGLQGLYWVAPRIGVGLGGFAELRSIGYQWTGPVTTSSSEGSITTDAFHAFTSVLWTFGK
jgi:hypothetical protein